MRWMPNLLFPVLLAGCEPLWENAADLPYPVCEPSAALMTDCPGVSGKCVIVADDDITNKLFLFPLSVTGLGVSEFRSLHLEGATVDDIEALVGLGPQRLLILGSHSRKKSCKTVLDRRKILVADIRADKLHPLQRPTETRVLTAKDLVPPEAQEHSKILRAFANAIEVTEGLAEHARIAEDRDACEHSGAIDIEGAAAVHRSSTEPPAVWVGLRKPLLAWAGSSLAILLRLADAHELRFDQVVLLDLGGRGIRELSSDGTWLWGIAGGPLESQNNFTLWRIPLPDLLPDAILKPETVRPLPFLSEGLAIVAERGLVFIDRNGGHDWKSAECGRPGKYLPDITLKGSS